MSGINRDVFASVKQKATTSLDAAQAAINNEQITRRRVDQIEALLSRKLLGRLRWLFLGR